MNIIGNTFNRCSDFLTTIEEYLRKYPLIKNKLDVGDLRKNFVHLFGKNSSELTVN